MEKDLPIDIDGNKPKIPISLYSGGPNEQGFSDFAKNENAHNFGNHLVPIIDPNWNYYNGMKYNEFPNAYPGNLIYDIYKAFFYRS